MINVLRFILILDLVAILFSGAELLIAILKEILGDFFKKKRVSGPGDDDV